MLGGLKTWLLSSGVVVSYLLFVGTGSLHASPDELLEKAIYTEETVGNLADAIKLYEQVIATAKSGNHAAAQAQYRLGLCYQKQQKRDLARDAFRAVIDSYPAEKELVQLAQKQLPGTAQLESAPWQDGESLHLVMRLANGMEAGTMIYQIQSTQHDGKPVWECSTRGYISINGVNSFSRVVCDKETFAPIISHWRHASLGVADAKYSENHVEIVVKGKQDPVKLDFIPPVWDNEQAFEVLRRLPLQVGYKTELHIISTLGTASVPLKIEVSEKEAVEVPAGKFECYKIVLHIGLGAASQTFWISADEHRYVTRFDTGNVTADLTRITSRRADQVEPCAFEGLKLQLPQGWNYFLSATSKDDPKRKLLLLDPQGLATGHIEVAPLASLTDQQRASVKAWADSFATDMSNKVQEFRVGDAGTGERQVIGQPAAVVGGTFKQGTTDMEIRGVGWFHGERAMHLQMTAPAEYFPTLQPAIDELLDSIQLE